MLCQYFQWGSCKYGKKCFNLHQVETAGSSYATMSNGGGHKGKPKGSSSATMSNGGGRKGKPKGSSSATMSNGGDHKGKPTSALRFHYQERKSKRDDNKTQKRVHMTPVRSRSRRHMRSFSRSRSCSRMRSPTECIISDTPIVNTRSLDEQNDSNKSDDVQLRELLARSIANQQEMTNAVMKLLGRSLGNV